MTYFRKYKMVILLILVIALTTLAWSTTLASPARSETQVAPDVINHPAGGPAGVYVFYDWQNLDPNTYPITGGHILVTWDKVEVGPNTYDWSWPDNWINSLASLGKEVGLAFNAYDGQCCGGISIPAYLKQQSPSTVVTCSDDAKIPRYWDPDYKTAFSSFVHAMGHRYNNDPRIAWVQISVGVYGEPTPAEDGYYSCMKQAGLTSDMWLNFVKWSIDVHRDAFPDKQLLLQMVPYFEKRSERIAFTDYAASQGVGLKHSALKPDGGDEMIYDDPNSSTFGGGQYDPLIKWGDKVATAWEGYDTLSWSLKGRTASMWGIYNALDKHPDYFTLDIPLIVADDRQDLVRFANTYAGRSLVNTPSVWVALRETQYTYFPDRGNFEFWLYQDDSAPGGRTVPLWNVSSAAEGRYTRRTDQGSGHPNMYFNVDNRYAFGSRHQATITVTYYDQGNDRWELHYDAYDDPDKLAGTVYKQNTRTWKQTQFTVADAHFGDRQPGGNDFRIWSANDGDETIHFVDVVVQPGVPVTLILEPGVNGYQGLKDTYIDAWSPMSNFGTEPGIWVRSRDVMYGLLAFDLAALPRNAAVVSATLHLYQQDVSNTSNNLTLAAHRLLRPWDESATTWKMATSHTPWTAPGATGDLDRVAAAVSSVELRPSAMGPISLNVTSLVQLWANNPSANYGLLLSGTSGGSVAYDFGSTSTTSPEARPRLTIEYFEPSQATPTPTRTPTRQVTATSTPTSGPTPTRTPSAPARSLVSRRAVNPPTIDGNLAEWVQSEHALLDASTVDYLTGQVNPSATDISARVYSMWDDNWLYFAARVEDDVIVRDSANIWWDDGLELALDGANDQVSGGTDDHQFNVASDGARMEFGWQSVPDAQLVAKRRAGGYDVELAVPATILASGALVEGKTMGFTVGLIDDDDGGDRSGSQDSYMVWEGRNTVNGAADFGKLILHAAIDGPTTTPSATAAATATPPRTNTPTNTPLPTATATRTPSPTATSTETWTPSPTLTPTATPTATPDVGTVDGVAFDDLNGDSSWNVGEPGLASAVLVLKRDQAETYTATSNADGIFAFDGIAPGQYVLIEKIPPPGYQINTIPVVLEVRANQHLPNVNIAHKAASTPTATATRTWTPSPTAMATATPTATHPPT
ncbi:MAG: hypothetical protein CVT63_03540, partial [Candidatus Anoxymicrobium japonicum]